MLILDAFNILHAWRSASGGTEGVAQLLAALSSGRYAGREITLVCDGDAHPHAPQDQAMITRLLSGDRVRRVLYAGSHREADDLIEDLIREAQSPGALAIVSSDRRLRTAAARAGAQAITSRAFIADLAADLAKAAARTARDTGPLDRASVAWWVNYFNLDGSPRERPQDALPLTAPRSSTKPASHSQPRAIHAKPLLLEVDLSHLDPADLDMERWLKQRPGSGPLHRPTT